MLRFSVKGGVFLKKILGNRYFNYLVLAILIGVFLLLSHHSWWIALCNTVGIFIVEVLTYKPVQKINRNRNRYYPSWVQSLVFVILILISFNVESHSSNIAVLWFLFFALILVTIIFPELPEK